MALAPETIKQPFWAMKQEEVLRILETTPSGLDDSEVSKRSSFFGPNEISGQMGAPKIKLFLNQFKSPLIGVLLAAGAVTLFLREWTDAGVILAAVVVNTFLGFYQESKAENALEALRSYIRTRTRVKRNGTEKEMDAKLLVPGDIIRVSHGDRIPADARMLFANEFEVDESVLTGESLPVRKDPVELPAGTDLADRDSMIFSGTLAVQGFGDAVVTATANATEFGRIAAFVKKQEREKTPLQQALERFTLISGLVLGGLVLLLITFGVSTGYTAFEMFLIGVAVAVSAVPEGLPIAFTVVLAIGVERLARKKGVVRRLLAAETLGSTSIILTDKTGTLTQAKMEIAAVTPCGNHTERDVIEAALSNTDVIIENPDAEPEQWVLFGRAIEGAIVKGAHRYGINAARFFKEKNFAGKVPFNSRVKFSAIIEKIGNEQNLIVLGAPDIISEFCVLSADERASLHAEVDRGARDGLRILGTARRRLGHETGEGTPKKFANLEFLGLVSFHDPLRPNVQDAVKKIERAGVSTIIVTGDHQGTAEAVAREIGLIDGKGAVLTGEDLAHLKKDELLNRANATTVYARVTPEQKMMLVNLYKEKGEVVAVTGDGVNDAPALQAADIGVAMGSGTDVAKNAADLVILDDNFETIVEAIEEGRRIMDNIRKVIVYLLSNSLDELLLIGGSLLFGLALPLSALQILFVNFFSDSFPAIGFAFEKGIDGLGRKPRKISRNLFDREMRILILGIGSATSAFLFLLYYSLLNAGFDETLVRSFIFATFATYSLVFAFSLRSLEKSIISFNPFSNSYLTAGVMAGLALTGLAVYLPFLQNVLGTVALPPLWALSVLGVGLANIAAVEFGKLMFRLRNRHLANAV